MKIKQHKFFGVFSIGSKIATLNLVSGEKVYGEQLFKIGGKEYREWIPFRSKPAAAIKCGLKIWPLETKMKILYLGAGSGTTCSHFSDIIGKEGLIYAVDIAEKPLKDLVRIAELRGNIVTILGDSRKPENYENVILDKVDVIYSDTADPQQVEIIIRNAQEFLKPQGYGIIAIKSQSINSSLPPNQVYKECLEKLEKHFKILDKVELDPYQKNHLFLVMKLK